MLPVSHPRPAERRLTRAIHAALFGMALAANASNAAHAADTTALTSTAAKAYNIPAGPLGRTLSSFAVSSGVALSFDPALTEGLNSPGLSGTHAPRDAAQRLLDGSGLDIVPRSDGSYTLKKREIQAAAAGASASGETLQTVTITAQAERSATTEGTGSYTHAGPSGTATPLGLTLQETPQSVSVITKQRMEDQGLTTVSQVMAQVPGVTQYSIGTERTGFTSRGYAINNYQLDGVNTASHNEGLNAQASQSTADMAVYDRIEVLRGASGLMTGAGDPSGTINMVRKKPTADFQASVEAGVGSWGEKRGVLDLSGPINAAGSLRGRFVTAWQDGDSFIDHYSNEKKTFYGVLEADLTDTTRLTVGVEHQRRKTNGAFAYLGFPLWFSDGSRTDLPRSFSPASRDNRFDSRTTTTFATLEQELGSDWRLKVSANRLRSSQREEVAYLDTSASFTDPVTGDGLMLYSERRMHDLGIDSFDVNVRGPVSLFGRRHELVFGADYQDFTNHTKGSFDESGLDSTPQNIHTWDRTGAGKYGDTYVTYDNPRSQKSLYAAGRFALSEQLKLITGAKVFSYDTNNITRNVAGYYSAAPASERNVWTPYAGLVYDIDGRHMAYASYSSIYKPQSAQDRYGQLIGPRKGINYEVGIKSDWLDGTLNTAVALYQIRQDNLTESDPGYTVPGAPDTAASRAIKGANTQGVDVEASGALTKSWNVSGSWTYSQTKNADGKRITTTFPRHMVKLWTTYRMPGDWNRLTLGGGVNVQSKTYSTVNAWRIGKELSWEQKPFAVATLMARYDFSDKLSATLNVNNLFDKKYITSVSDWWYSGYYGAPRSVALNVKYKF